MMPCSLTFCYKPGQLTKDVDLIFTFEVPHKEVGDEFAAWHTARLVSDPTSNAINQFRVDFSGRLGFGVAQVESDAGRVIIPGSMIEVKPGQSTVLTSDGASSAWSNPTTIAGENKGEIMRVSNKAGRPKTIAFGTVKSYPGGHKTLLPAFLFRKVEDKTFVEVSFYPKLKMYVNHGRTQNDFLTAMVESDEPIWTGDLSVLAPSARFGVTENSQGGYAVNLL